VALTFSGTSRGGKKESVTFFTLAAVLSLALHLRAAYAGPSWQVYVFKPLTTSLLIALAVGYARRAAAEAGGSWPRYHGLLCAGLLWSLAGDVFLMLPGDWFVAGLASFLAAHLCYIAAFTRDTPRWGPAVLAVPYVAALGLLLALLWPHLGLLRTAVVLYGTALAAMAWLAAARWSVRRTVPTASAAAGGALFMTSDGALAIDRFAAPFSAATVVVMVTYVAAQWLIVQSLREGTTRA
jgi:uncharacterized membrane protein YhhN